MSSISVQNAEMCKGIVLDALGLVNSVDPDHDNLTAMLILQGPKAYCYDALSALDVGSNVVSKASAAGLNDSGYDLDNMVRTASLSVSGNDVAVLDQYRQRRLQEKGSQSGTA